MDYERRYLTQEETDLARALAVELAMRPNPWPADYHARISPYREVFEILVSEMAPEERSELVQALEMAVHHPRFYKRPCLPFLHDWKYTNRYWPELGRYASGVRCAKCHRTKPKS